MHVEGPAEAPAEKSATVAAVAAPLLDMASANKASEDSSSRKDKVLEKGAAKGPQARLLCNDVHRMYSVTVQCVS